MIPFCHILMAAYEFSVAVQGFDFSWFMYICRYDLVLQKCWLPTGRERPTFSELVQLLEAEKRTVVEMESGFYPHTPPDRPYFVLENLANIVDN